MLPTRGLEMFIFLCFNPTLSPSSSDTVDKPCNNAFVNNAWKTKANNSCLKRMESIFHKRPLKGYYLKDLFNVGIIWRLGHMDP